MIATCETPIGPLKVVASEQGISSVSFGAGVATKSSHPLLKACISELQAYFEGRLMVFTVPLVMPGTVFQKRAWQVLSEIPYGKTMAYQTQAETVGDAKACRAVANANAANPIPIIVPCHRVIRASGAIGGYAGGVATKAWLLAHETKVKTSSPGSGP